MVLCDRARIMFKENKEFDDHLHFIFISTSDAFHEMLTVKRF